MQQAKRHINFREEVFSQVKKIPIGKVCTYGQVALLLGKPRGAREVGWMLHSNDRVDVPCYRIVDRNGRVATNFGGPSLWSFGRRAPSKFSNRERSGAFDGAKEQRRRLMAEGVGFIDEMHVDLKKHLWKIG